MRAPFLLSASSAVAFIAWAQAQAQIPIQVQGQGFDELLLHSGLEAQHPLLNPGITDSVSGDEKVGDVYTDTGPDTQGIISCVACEAALLQLKLAASRGDDFFVALTSAACRILKIEDDDVCEGAFALEGPIIAHSLRGLSIGSKTSRLACVALFGWCAFPEVETYNASFPSPKPETRRPKPSGQTPLRIVHYSDIHIDPWYTEGADANCTKFICCRKYADEPTPGHVMHPAGPNGEHTCDSPIGLEQSMYRAIRTLAPDAAFGIFTGDIVDHAVWNTSVTQNTLEVVHAYDRMAAAGMRVYGTAGNHEASPANSYPPRGVDSSTQWLYDILSGSWARWIGDRAADATKAFGAYSAKYPGGNLRIISLSTNLFYVHNYWLYAEPMEKDPSGQFAWLIDELDEAEKAGERVYIMGHMAPGGRDAFHDASNYFDQIVNRYEATIAALFFGHTHLDEFEIFYSDYSQRKADNAVAVSFIAPSMTPTSGHPAFRIIDVDPVTFGVLDITTYIANTSHPAFQSADGPVWTKYYSAREEYGALVGLSPAFSGVTDGDTAVEDTRELDPAFWHSVTEALEELPSAFEQFMARKSRGWQPGVCENDCKRTEICKLRAGRAQDNCILASSIRLDMMSGQTNNPAVGLGEHDCGSSVVADTLSSLASDPEMRAWIEMMLDRD